MAMGHEIRAEIHNEYLKALLLINGGAAIALMALFPDIITSYPAMIKPVVICLPLFGLGCFTATISFYLREIVSRRFESNMPDKKVYDWFSRGFMLLSPLCFLIALIIISCGAYSSFVPEKIISEQKVEAAPQE